MNNKNLPLHNQVVILQKRIFQIYIDNNYSFYDDY